MKLILAASNPTDPPFTQRVTLSFARESGETIDMFFDVRGADAISDAAIHDCAYVLGSSLAYWMREDYGQEYPVDSRLYRHVYAAHSEWAHWPGGVKARKSGVETRAPQTKPPTASKTALFFSGGVDSYFTLLDMPYAKPRTISLEHVEDQRSEIEAAFSRLSELHDAAADCGADGAIGIVTNMMLAHPVILDQWAPRFHGCFLAACAHLVSDTVNHVAISSTFTYGSLKPWGSHLVIDPLWSSSRLQIEHYGATHTRVEKTDAIAQSEIARQALSVCEHGRYQQSDALNCSECIKCYRTMLTLDALGYKPEQVSAFDWSKYTLQRTRQLFVHGRGEARLLQEIIDLAGENGRTDIQSALKHAIQRSRPMMWITWIERLIRRKLPWIIRFKAPLNGFKNGLMRTLGYRMP